MRIKKACLLKQHGLFCDRGKFEAHREAESER